jgi:hypothetical protein
VLVLLSNIKNRKWEVISYFVELEYEEVHTKIIIVFYTALPWKEVISYESADLAREASYSTAWVRFGKDISLYIRDDNCNWTRMRHQIPFL